MFCRYRVIPNLAVCSNQAAARISLRRCAAAVSAGIPSAPPPPPAGSGRGESEVFTPVENMERTLRRQLGAQALISVRQQRVTNSARHRDTNRNARDTRQAPTRLDDAAAADDGIEEGWTVAPAAASPSGSAGAAPPVPASCYRASVSFRQCGFGVTLATAESVSSEAAALEAAYQQAASSDVAFIDPSTRASEAASYDRLRYHALGLGRMVRFAISTVAAHRAQAAGALQRRRRGSAVADTSEALHPSSMHDQQARLEQQDDAFVCVVYERSDWAFAQRDSVLCCGYGTTRGAALQAGVVVALERLSAEASGAAAREDITEVHRYLDVEYTAQRNRVSGGTYTAAPAHAALSGIFGAGHAPAIVYPITTVAATSDAGATFDPFAEGAASKPRFQFGDYEASALGDAHLLDSAFTPYWAVNTTVPPAPAVNAAAAAKSLPSITPEDDGPRGNNGQNHQRSVRVLDRFGNGYSVASGAARTAMAAFRSCALQVYKRELAEVALPPRSLLGTVAWQVEGLAWLGGIGNDPDADLVYSCAPLSPHQQQPAGTKEGPVGSAGAGALLHASLYVRNAELAQLRCRGEYRTRLNCYCLALERLLQRCPPHVAALFPVATLGHLRQMYTAVDSGLLNVADACGSKGPTPLNVLGVCTNAHVNQFYQLRYENLPAGSDQGAGGGGGRRGYGGGSGSADADNVRCEVTLVNPNDASDVYVVGSGIGRGRGQAARAAAINTLRANFGHAYDAVRDLPEFQARTSSDDGTASTPRLKALPKDRRISHMNSLLSLLKAFGAEEKNWGPLTLDAVQRVTSATSGSVGNTWVAVLSTVDAKSGAPLELCRSPLSPSKSDARKRAIYLAGVTFFPTETAIYMALGRSDVARAEVDAVERYLESMGLSLDGFGGANSAQMVGDGTPAPASVGQTSGDGAGAAVTGDGNAAAATSKHDRYASAVVRYDPSFSVLEQAERLVSYALFVRAARQKDRAPSNERLVVCGELAFGGLGSSDDRAQVAVHCLSDVVVRAAGRQPSPAELGAGAPMRPMYAQLGASGAAAATAAEGDTAASANYVVLARSALKSVARDAVQAGSMPKDQLQYLLNSYEDFMPQRVARARDLCSYLFTTTLGADSVRFHCAQVDSRFWIGVISVRVPFFGRVVLTSPTKASDAAGRTVGLSFASVDERSADEASFAATSNVVPVEASHLEWVEVCRVASASKKEATNRAWLRATQVCFTPHLKYLSRQSMELQPIADEILEAQASVATTAPLEPLWSPEDRAHVVQLAGRPRPSAVAILRTLLRSEEPNARVAIALVLSGASGRASTDATTFAAAATGATSTAAASVAAAAALKGTPLLDACEQVLLYHVDSRSAASVPQVIGRASRTTPECAEGGVSVSELVRRAAVDALQSMFPEEWEQARLAGGVDVDAAARW
jgi:hypothetical protein